MTPTEIRITSRADLLSYVPYALGFHPADSIVLVGLTKNALEMAARADANLPTREVIDEFAKHFTRRRCITAGLVLGYGPEEISGPTRTVTHGLRARGHTVRESLRVAEGRFHCLQCDGCTPPDGEVFDSSASPVAAAATYAGRVVRPSREAVERMVRPIGGLAALAMTQAVDRAEQRLDGLRSNTELIEAGKKAVDETFRAAEAGQRPADDAVAWLSVLMAEVAVRDHAWRLTTGEDWQLELWLQLTRRAEPILAAPMASLLAWCAWRQGDAGALTLAAVERALRIDPCYELARLMADLLYQRQPPSCLEQWPLVTGSGCG